MAHSADMEKVALAAAQQKAMAQGAKPLPHGCRLFEVEKGWESGVIRRDPTTTVADTLLALEAALGDPDAKVIFIPHDALMTERDIEKLCQRNAITKTFFKEVEKA